MLAEPRTEAEMVARYKAVRNRLNPKPQPVKIPELEPLSATVEMKMVPEIAPAWIVNKAEFWPLLVPRARYLPPKLANSILTILKVVCAVTKITPKEVCSNRRTAPVVEARQIIMYLCRNYTGHSYPEIGRRLGGRDHTTIIHGFRSIESKRLTDERLDALVKALETAIEAEGMSRAEAGL